MAYICPAQHVKLIDNFVRLWIHDPQKMFAPFVKPGMRVLDIGCGGGFAALGMAQLVGDYGRVVAADLQPRMLEVLAQRAAGAGLSERISLVNCSEDDLGVTPPPFDFINAFYMVHEVPDKAGFLTQVRALMAPAGLFFIAEPRFHVSEKAFIKTIQTAIACSFKPVARPAIRFSHAAVFSPF